MNTPEMIEQIAEKNFDINAFVQLAIENEHARETIVSQMLTNSAIMVYYHCYDIVNQASQEAPELFYSYWQAIAELLHHKNSYHRDFALEIIGNLSVVDRENRFAEIQDEYFSIINDEKFMTGNCCVKNMLKIYRNKPEQRERIIETLLDIDNRCDYTEKQKGVLKADVLEIFEKIYNDVPDQNRINQFIRTAAKSISPKTRKKAKGLINKYTLPSTARS